MILVIEPVFPNAHHAPSNAGVLMAIGLAAENEPIAFAAHPAHRDAVFSILGDAALVRFDQHDIDVMPAGGISLRRFCLQAGTLFDLTRRLRPRLIVCLGTQPETLFSCRLLKMRHPGVGVIAVLHGNLHQATAWRSRDPRRRWFDDRAALSAAIGSPTIQFVVLAQAVADAAISMGLLPRDRCHVWPLAIPPSEVLDRPHRLDPNQIRIAFVGSAKRAKGFNEFVALTRQLAAQSNRYEFSLIGELHETYATGQLAHIKVPGGFLERGDFIERLYAVDYICLPLRDDTYTLTVSAALLDAIAARKPLIALPTPAIRHLFNQGPAGFLCDDLAAMADAMGNPDRLADPIQYGRFRDTLSRLCQERSPAGLALIIAPLIAPGAQHRVG